MSALEDVASDALPVCLSISDRGRGRAKAVSSDWPSGFGDPDPSTRLDAIHCASCFLEVGVESVEALFDADAFPVGVAMKVISMTRQRSIA